MRTLRAVSMGSVFLLVLGLSLAQLAEAVAEPRLLDGERWRTLSPDAKITYVWGIGNLVELERTNGGQQAIKPPSAERKSFIPYLARGLSGLSINHIINHIDAYYTAHPNDLERPVIDAIFQAVVLPRLKAERVGGQSR